MRMGAACLIIMLAAGQPAEAALAQEQEQEYHEQEQPEEEPEPTIRPTPEVTEAPEITEAPVQVDRYVLQHPKAKYKKGNQTGIHYHKVKGKKVYYIDSYTTDTVSLIMTHDSTYCVYGGASKKEVRKKQVTVSQNGIVKCHNKNSEKNIYAMIQAQSKQTGEKQYIYINFHKRLISRKESKIQLYEKHTQGLSFNYAKKNLQFHIKDRKIASIDEKGKLTAKKKGTTYVTAKVKDSEKNEIKMKIIVREEPWIVNNKKPLYDYQDMTSDIHRLAHKYHGRLSYYSIGQTYDKREIWCMRIGNPNASKHLVIDAAIHAREWLNTQMLMRSTEQIMRDYSEYSERFRHVCLYILPMDNPDGVTISQHGYEAIRNKKLQKKIQKIGHTDTWKNNARGVNINNNFDCGFKKSKKAKKGDWVFYSGKKAESERETKALVKFINKTEPHAVLNLHSTGSIIYWDFAVGGALHEKLENLAKKVKSFNHYRLMPRNSSTSKGGGFADWLVYEKQIPSITVETGNVPCPLPRSQYKSVEKKNEEMLSWYMTKY